MHAIDKYGFSNPWDITTLGYVSSHGADYGDQGLEGVSVVDSGNKLYTLWSSGAVGQYDLSTPNDLSTLSLVNTFDISSELTDAGGLFMKEDGTKLYVVGRTNNTVYQYSLSTPYDLSTLSYDATSYDASYVGMTNSHAIFFNSDGTKFYIADNAGDSTLFEFDLTTPWDISTASSTSDLISLDGQAYWPSALSFNGSGESVLMSEAFNNILNALTGTGH